MPTIISATGSVARPGPGYIWTPLVEDLGRNSPQGVDAFRRELDSRHPIGHVGEPSGIGYGVVYLASDEAKFMTGASWSLTGGTPPSDAGCLS